VLQAPQCPGSVARSTQADPQAVCPAGQLGDDELEQLVASTSAAADAATAIAPGKRRRGSAC